jgi:hypothetical protein
MLARPTVLQRISVANPVAKKQARTSIPSYLVQRLPQGVRGVELEHRLHLGPGRGGRQPPSSPLRRRLGVFKGSRIGAQGRTDNRGDDTLPASSLSEILQRRKKAR